MDYRPFCSVEQCCGTVNLLGWHRPLAIILVRGRGLAHFAATAFHFMLCIGDVPCWVWMLHAMLTKSAIFIGVGAPSRGLLMSW